MRTEEEQKSLNPNRYAATDKHQYTTIQYYNNANNRFNGIITKLGNGFINITSSQVDISHYPNIVVYFSDARGYFNFLDILDSWLAFDYKDRKVEAFFLFN